MIAESHWPEVLGGLNFLRKEATRPAPSPEYFLWLVNVLSKLVLLQMAIETERSLEANNFEQAMQLLRLLGYQFGHTAPFVDEPAIRLNLMFWLA